MSERLSFEDAARELGVSEDELEKLVAAGEIASTKEGDSLFISREAVDAYKQKQGEEEPAILLSDEEINFLEDEDEDVDFGIEVGGQAASGGEKTDELSTAEVSSDEGTDALEGSEETVVNLEGLEDEGTSSAESGGSLLEDEGLGDDTLLDTDVLDLGEEDTDTDTFDLETAEETVLDTEEEGTLLRGGGARVMQMKRKQGSPVWTALLAGSALVLLLPFAILLSTVWIETLSPGAVAAASEDQAWGWIQEYNYFKGLVDGLAGLFR